LSVPACRGLARFIIAWSRGAVQAVQLANLMKEKGITVRFLVLIDPVSKNMGKLQFNKIPSNVKVVSYHYAGAPFKAADEVQKNIANLVNPGNYGQLLMGALVFPQDFFDLEDSKATKVQIQIYPDVSHANSGVDKEIREDLRKIAEKEAGLKFNP
jgi:hypothetical protein